MEVWKDIKGYEGLYQVSNTGRVKSLERKVKNWPNGLRTIKERILKPALNGRESRKYYAVNLYKNGKPKLIKIHRLVALHFVPNPDSLPQVNHIDNDPLNNHYKNLEWGTQRENMAHAYSFKKTSSEYTGVSWDKVTKSWASCIRIDGKTKHLGKFTNEISASMAYQAESNKL